MLSEKPWRKEFDKLAEEMRARWNGEMIGVVDREDHSSASILQDTYVYPTLKATIDRFPVQVTVSEFALPGLSLVEGSDNVEYLSIMSQASCAFNAALRHERFFDRIQKKIGLEVEAQTGNKDFDKKYFIISKLKEDISPLKLRNVQEKVISLEPFSGLHFATGGITLAQVIDDESVLSIRNFERIIKQLIDLAKLVSMKR